MKIVILMKFVTFMKIDRKSVNLDAYPKCIGSTGRIDGASITFCDGRLEMALIASRQQSGHKKRVDKQNIITIFIINYRMENVLDNLHRMKQCILRSECYFIMKENK